MDIAEWLRELGLSQYEQAFRDNAVDADTLPRLTPEDLRELGVSAVGHRRKLLDAIVRLREATESHLGPAAGQASLAPPFHSGAERRQLTVLFCDLADSTMLASTLDPEDYRAVLGGYHRACAETVARFEGFVAKYMGDGVLAYFGYPQAHEDEASRAVLAGLALVTRVAQLAVPDSGEPLSARVGIATGLVVVGDLLGVGSAQEQSVAGETPNLAARLQTIAPPGGVVIAQSTQRLLGSEFHLSDLGSLDLKGFVEPVTAWRVLGTSAAESRFEARVRAATRLIGRAKELETLVHCWEQARDGQGQAVVLSGEAGIGKSRLARGLAEHVHSEPHTQVQLQCSPFFSNSPLRPFRDHLERAAGFRENDTSDERLAKLESLLAQASINRATAVPVIATMLSVPIGARHPPPTHDPQRQKQLTVEVLITFILSLAKGKPLLLIMEDLHWADPTTLEVLEQLFDRIASKRVLLLVSFRPEFAHRGWGRSNITLISLDRLSRVQTTELAGAVAGRAELPPEVMTQILARTDGVPLFVEELTKAVLENGIQGATRRRAQHGRPTSFEIPATLHDSLMARLDRLTGAKAVARHAAVIGREFTYAMLAAIGGWSELDLDTALQQLVSSELVFVVSSSPTATYNFKHALIRDAAYESLLKSSRQELHGRIAAVLEEHHPDVTTGKPELIAHHLTEARLAERAVPYWQRAAEDAARRQAHQEVMAHCTRGLELLSLITDENQRDEYELRLQVRLGNSAVSAKGWGAPEVRKALYRARELTAQLRDDRLLHPILSGLYVFHAVHAELRTAEKLGIELLALGEAKKDRVVRVDGHKVLLNACYKLGKFEDAREHFDRGMSLYGESAWPELSVEHIDDPGPHLLIFGACVMWVLGHPDRARRAAADAVALGHRHANHLSTIHAVYVAGHVSELMDDWHGVQKSNEETLALAAEWGFSGLPDLVARRKRLVAVALRSDPEQMEYKRRHPQPGFARSLHDSVLARAYGRRGAPEEGLRVLDETLSWAEETGGRFFDAEVYRIRAELFLLAGRIDQAEHSYRTALEIAREQRARMWELKAVCELAQMLRDQGRHDEARSMLMPVFGWFSEGFDTDELRRAKALLVDLGDSNLG